MNAAELLTLLEVMRDQNIPLHKLTVRVEVSDDYYNRDIKPDDIYEARRPRQQGEERYLIIHGD